MPSGIHFQIIPIKNIATKCALFVVWQLFHYYISLQKFVNLMLLTQASKCTLQFSENDVLKTIDHL